MTQVLIALSFWLHSLATVVFIGHYLLLSLIYLPAMSSAGTMLSAISRRSRTWLYVSMLVFAVTGVYLTFIDPNYAGIGNFSNPWAILMLVKHILLVGMVGMGAWFNALLRVGPMMGSNSGADQAIARFRQYANLMAGAGVLVLLLTAISQAQ